MELPGRSTPSVGSCQPSSAVRPAVPSLGVRRYYSVSWSSRFLYCRLRAATLVNLLYHVILAVLALKHQPHTEGNAATAHGRWHPPLAAGRPSPRAPMGCIQVIKPKPSSQLSVVRPVGAQRTSWLRGYRLSGL